MNYKVSEFSKFLWLTRKIQWRPFTNILSICGNYQKVGIWTAVRWTIQNWRTTSDKNHLCDTRAAVPCRSKFFYVTPIRICRPNAGHFCLVHTNVFLHYFDIFLRSIPTADSLYHKCCDHQIFFIYIFLRALAQWNNKGIFF